MIEFRWIKRSSNIDTEEWNTIFGGIGLKNQALFKVTDYAFEDKIEHTYCCIYLDNNIKAIIPCFEYQLKFDVTAPPKVQSTIENIRRIYSSFLTTKVFVLGTYISTCQHYIGGDLSFLKEHRIQLSQEINRQTKKQNAH